MILSTRFGNSRYRRLQTAISWLSLCPVMLLSCAKQPRPAVLSELDAVRQTQAAVEAAAFAPQSYAEAEGLRDTAEREWQAGHAASSQIAAERALSAYERTRTLARIVRTERDLVQTQFQLKESKAALSQLEARQKQVAAEQADLEMQLKVERDAEQLAAPSPTNPAREAARREVARALSAQGRLLCASARLLSAPLERIEAKYKQLDQLDEQLAKQGVPTPIDIATRLRSECLQQLVQVRRPQIAANPQGTAGDELFVKLSMADLTPSRDDRGIAVTVPDAFVGEGLSANAKASLKRLEPIIKAESAIALLVVVHAPNGNASRDEARGRKVVAELAQMGASKTDLRVAGDRLPLVERSLPGAAKRNERLELVFVIPAT